MSEENWQVLYHYTSLNGFQRILETGYLALNDIIKSNDPAEGTYSMQMLQKAYRELYQDGEIDNDTYRRFHSAYFEFSEDEKAFGRLQHAVLSVSFCEPKLPLALWRTYGDNGRGVSLGISKERLKTIGEKENFSFQAIAYLSEEEMLTKYRAFWKSHIQSQEAELKDAIEKQYLEGYFIKRPENAYEKEWRLVYEGLNFRDYLLIPPKVPENICAYMRQDDVVFYYTLPVKGENLLEYVYTGPQCKIADSEMRCLLAKYGFKNCSVSRDDTIMR